MLIQIKDRESLNSFFTAIKLKDSNNNSGINKAAKIEQILAYLEIIHTQVRQFSRTRNIVLIESAAGNCYLSFLIYYYYKEIDKRLISIHCIDTNHNLMTNAKILSENLGFDEMYFHTGDTINYRYHGKVDLVYSLHACDSATDKTIFMGLTNNAGCILSVSCCQHTIKKHLKNPRYRGITRHGIFKDRMVYMVSDSLRALLLEMKGYKPDIFEFVSSRYTDKNIMLRAKKSSISNTGDLNAEYEKIKNEFKVTPELEKYIRSEEDQLLT